jgi:hypothetical protein
MSTRPHHVAFQSLYEVALVVDLGQTIDDGHAVDLFVVLCFGVRAGEELQNRGAHFDAIPIVQLDFAWDLILVHVGAVRASVVDCPPVIAPAFQMSAPPTHAIAFQNNVIVRTTPDAEYGLFQNEPLTEQRLFGRIDHDEAVRAGPLLGSSRLNHLCDPSLFVAVVQESPTMSTGVTCCRRAHFAR